MNHFGVKIRDLREKQNLLLRQVAAYLEIDTALISKIERGERKASREQVEKISELLKTDKSELIKLWLSDRIYQVISDESVAAEEAVKYVLKKMKKK